MSKKALVPVNVLSSNHEPTGLYAGDVYFNENTQSLFIYNGGSWVEDRKSTRLNSSHTDISRMPSSA